MKLRSRSVVVIAIVLIAVTELVVTGGKLFMIKEQILLYKIEWFIDFFATNKIYNLTCVIIHDNLTRVIIHDNLTCVDYHETH